ncbi:MAG: ABC transporter ATP-binding protein [Acidimicrobiia bacterium]
MDAALQLEGVTFEYGGTNPVRALSGVDLEVTVGEMLAITGPSGSGKTTLLLIAGSLLRPSGGRVLVSGTDVTRLSRRDQYLVRRDRIGFVFQDAGLFEHLTAVQNVEMALLYRGLSPNQRESKALTSLASVGLGDRGNHLPGQLSSGEAQRVGIARSFAGSPSLILADEPTGNLDRRSSLSVVDQLKALRDQGVAVVMVTHDEEVASLTDRTVRLSDGRLGV